MWILHSRGVTLALHYLDDFLLIGPPSTQACQAALCSTLSTCEELGLPVAPEKTEGPDTTLTFLGIEIDTVAGQLRLPQEKLRDLQATIRKWMQSGARPVPRRSGKKRDLLSLIGLLNHAATVVRPGRGFLRALIDASATTPHLDHWVHLNAPARADISWWHTFMDHWNGISLVPPAAPAYFIISDASGSWGCGALHYIKPVVAASMAPRVVGGADRTQGVGPHCLGGSSLWPSMGWHKCVLLVRQLGSSLGHQQRVSQRPQAHESTSQPVFFLRSV